jgi:hypothetical protein
MSYPKEEMVFEKEVLRRIFGPYNYRVKATRMQKIT